MDNWSRKCRIVYVISPAIEKGVEHVDAGNRRLHRPRLETRRWIQTGDNQRFQIPKSQTLWLLPAW